VALFFMPDVIRQDPRGEEYLVPYLMQDERFPFVVPAASPAAPEVLRLVEAIGAELPAATRVARLAVEAQLKMLLVELVRHYASAPGALESYHQREKALARLRPLFAHLDARPADRVSLARAARMVGMSEPRFTRFFKQITGQSFHAYVTRLGIARAQQLLRQGASASEVSQAVGFASASHFGVVFRRLTGMTPLEFRRRSVRDSL
jgi:AraC-like DNA-binding protein